MNIRRPAPDLPDRPYTRTRPPQGQSLVRAAFAVARTKNRYDDPVTVAKSLWPDDRAAVSLLTKADAVPGDIAAGNWAAGFAGTAVGEFIGSLAPVSAAAKLIAAGQRVTLSGGQSVLLPRRTTAPASDLGWVGSGEPISVYQRQLETVTLGPPKKLSALVVATRELLDYANGEVVLGQLLREDISATLDASMFDDSAGSAVRPAGLLNGVSPITASTATAARDKMIEDLANLSGAIVDAGGSGENIVFVCSPRQATFVRLNLISNEQPAVWATPALADGDIIAIQTDAFVSAFSAEPTITLAREATLHLAAPAGELVPGTESLSVFADPSRSLFQTDSVGLRITLPCAFCLRAPLIATVSATWGKASP